MKKKILIIDDDPDFTEATAAFLEAQGYAVLTADNGKEGFQAVKHESPDLVLLDMRMSYGSEGADVAQSLHQDAASKDIPIIMITGARREFEALQAKSNSEELPVTEVLEKPVKPDSLLRLVQQHLQKEGRHHNEIIATIEPMVEKWKGRQGNLVMILHEIQNHFGYVPRDISFELSRLLEVPLARIYEVITFYNFFKLEEPGRHIISVCMGTACYLKGTPQILQELKSVLNIEEGQTTKDGLFHLQVVRCLGCCGLAPVIMIDEKIYGKLKKEDIVGIVSEYVKQAQEKEVMV